MRTTLTLFLIAIASFAVLYFYFYQPGEQQEAQPIALTQEEEQGETISFDTPLEEQVAYWTEVMSSLPAENAKRRFDDWMMTHEGITPDMEHVLAHAYAKSLYQAYGINGAAQCDTQYAFGCWHQLMHEAMQEYGIEAPEELYAACTEAANEYTFRCTHALGHGFLGIEASYTNEARDAAIERCRASKYTENDDILFGCINGVIHEYSGAFVKLDQSVESEPVNPDTDGPLALCDGLEGEAMLICARRLADWWNNGIEQELDATGATKLAQMCNENRESLGRYTAMCYFGVGVNIKYSGVGNQYCDVISPNTTDVLWCKEGTKNVSYTYDDLETVFTQCEEDEDSCAEAILAIEIPEHGVGILQE